MKFFVGSGMRSKIALTRTESSRLFSASCFNSGLFFISSGQGDSGSCGFSKYSVAGLNTFMFFSFSRNSCCASGGVNLSAVVMHLSYTGQLNLTRSLILVSFFYIVQFQFSECWNFKNAKEKI